MKIILRHLLYGTYFATLILRQILLQLFFYKMGQTLQNASAFLLQNAANFYCKMRECYCKMRQLLQNETILLQNAIAICLIAQNK